MRSRADFRLARPVIIALSLFLTGPTLRFSAGTAQADEWEALRSAPGPSIQDICILPDGLHGWAVGGSGAGGQVYSCVLRTTDGGANWVPLPFPYPTSVVLCGVDFADALNGWVVGSAGAIYATTDGGDTWVRQTSGTARKLTKVCFLDALRGWATGGWQDGSSYLVLHTTNGGTNWVNQSFGTTAYSCEDICFIDALNGWVCGYDNAITPHIHHTKNGGVSWERQTVPTSGNGNVSSIDFASPTEGWATTSSLYMSPAGPILHTTNGGDTWTIQGYTGLHYNYAVDVRDALHAAIASVQILSPASEKVFVTTDGGETWVPHTPPVLAYTYGVQYVDTSLWICSDYGQVVRSHDEGLTWDFEYRAALWRSLTWSDDQHGWLAAGSSVGIDGYCLRSDDGGWSWWRDANAPGGAQVQFVDPNTGWMLWEGNSASVWRSTDGGLNWSRHYVGSSNWVGGICFATALRGWACGSNGTIRVTQDGGVTWASQSSGTANYVQEVFFVDPLEGWAVGGYGGGNGFIRHTVDGGDHWVAQTPASSSHFQAAYFLDKLHGWLGAVGGSVHRTVDGGQHWQLVGQVSHTYIDDVIMRDELVGWLVARNPSGGAAGEDGRGFIYRTDNGGESWSLEWSGPYVLSSISELAFRVAGEPWACGAHDAVLRYANPAGLAEEGPASPRLLLGRADPNPFTQSVSIGYTLPQPGHVCLAVYDLLGRPARVLCDGVRAAGTYRACWDGRDATGRAMSSGVYFARLEAGAQAATWRICLAR